YFTMADNITFDVYLSLLAGMQILMCYIIYLAAMEFAYWTLFVICPCLLAIAAITVACISTVAKRVKKGKWWENTVIYAVGCFAWLLICRMSKVLEKLIENISTVWKVIAGAAAYLIITVVVSNAKNGIITTVWIIMSVVVLAVICLGVLAADKLQKGAEKIARGDFEYQIDTHDLTLEFKRHAENLNKINQALSKAVDERTKSERFKAELITNVSHDIKTPLTSIINYVDLLKKLNIDSETAEQYIEVLDRQSARLKKLTLDLVEASKASTGNITVNFSPTDICELLLQSTGEYAEKFERAELELILDLPNDHIVISADGSLMWRVFDNILSNITKYAQSCTRVYISAEKSENNIVITFKNISREKLNVSSAELTERFVRGDSARSTEGSGLGLSIAKSFVELQNGNLEVMVDGDLFKITIIL
ncbi:MAG: HAMP domain-containing sensor histidine kinase, partial [Clostridia bacterium]